MGMKDIRGRPLCIWKLAPSVTVVGEVMKLCLCFTFFTRFCDASVQCNTTSDCERLLRRGSTCDAESGTCTNAFAEGCLRRMLGEKYPRRTCNSDDGAGRKQHCELSNMDYEEIRIYNQNWESAMFLSWIMQIWLSEFMEVPVTIETGTANRSFSFYDTQSSFDYGVLENNYDVHLEAHRIGDCRKTEKPCAHITPEVWFSNERYRRAKEEGYIEPAIDGNGMVGKISLFVPRMTSQRDPSLLSFYGLQGEANRRKLADTFKRPTSWLDYCTFVSTNNCTLEDGVASRPPRVEEEQNSYFVDGLYTGHFRYTEENDCDKHPASCTGHVADVGSCYWTTYMEAQLHWNNISLESNGSVAPNNAYSYEQMIQIWKAANATQSDVIMYWWTPEATLETFRNTPYEFQAVMLPQPTRACLNARTTDLERCSDNPVVRRGMAEGGCDYESTALQKYITKSLGDRTAAVPAVSRSPAYDAVKSFVVSHIIMEDILKKWATSEEIRIAADRYGHGAREVVCLWVAENLEYLEWLTPRGYPRTVKEEGMYSGGVITAAWAVAVLSIVSVLCTSVATYHWREKKVIVVARRRFLMLILFGLLLVSLAAFFVLFEPSLASCTARQWLITFGYTLSLVPLLVKVATINKLMNGAVALRRVHISYNHMFYQVGVAAVAVLIYLSVWTAVDPLTQQEERVLADEGEGVVIVYQTCASSSEAWVLVAMGWEILLLLCATVLAFQSRNVIREFNESQALGALVYTHLLFFAMRVTFYYLNGIGAKSRAAAVSFLLSADTTLSLVVYFGPKFLVAAGISTEKASLHMRMFSNRWRLSSRHHGNAGRPAVPNPRERTAQTEETRTIPTALTQSI